MSADKQQQPELAPGTVLDNRFQIVKPLGGGAFGAVYLANQMVFGRKLRVVALKLFKAANINASNFSEVFGDAITLIGLQEESPSPAIARHMIQIYDFGMLKSPDEQAFMSMKLVPGGKNLQHAVHRWQRGGMPVETALGYLRQILIPLAWMHMLDMPAVHGDLKPDNVLLTDDSELILTDFGLAARLPLGSRGGAIAYQAPESLLGVTAKAPADIYALGIIWYEMLTGQHPFAAAGLEATAAGNQEAFVRAHLEARKWEIRPAGPLGRSTPDHRIVPASEINLQLCEHPQLETMLNRCLQFDQSKRYVNARLLLDDVDRYIATGSVPPPPIRSRAPDEDEPGEIVLHDKTPEMKLQDALSLLGQGQADAAYAQINRVIAERANWLPAILAKARILVAKKDFRQARETCALAQRLDGKDPDVFAAMADLLQAEGKTDLAKSMRSQEQRLRLERSKSGRR